MEKIFQRVRSLFMRSALVFSFAAFLSPLASFGGDLIRVVEEEGEDVVERSISGTVVEITVDGVKFESASKKETVYAPERVVWTMFDGEPVELSAARVELEVGAYEGALEKLNAIEPNETASASENVRLEIAWCKALATTRLAFAEGAELKDAGKALSTFVKDGASHYRFYEANALIADVCRALGKSDDAEKYYAKLDEAQSESTRARGKVGRGELALASGDAQSAKALFSEVAGTELAPFDEGFEVRVAARIGLARAQEALDEREDAEKTLDETLKALPNGAALAQARTNVALGEVLAANGKAQEAAIAYLRVDLLYNAARTERVAALRALIPLWRALGREDRALETRERLRDRFGVEVE